MEGKPNTKTEREANCKGLLNTGNKLRVAGGVLEGMGSMGFKEGTCWDEQWVLYGK